MGKTVVKTHRSKAAPAVGDAAALIGLVIANGTVFVSSFCIMVIELVAGRLIAQYVGGSLYTWTSIIGVVLAGIALGNYVGGRLADRFATDRRAAKRTLAVMFIAAGLVAAGINSYNTFIGTRDLMLNMESFPLRIAIHISFVFFLPCAMLGLISPVVAKMALDLGRKTGRTIGSVYAWGVVGSIIGTFVTGFHLVAHYPNPTIVLSAAGVMMVMAVFYGLSAVMVRSR